MKRINLIPLTIRKKQRQRQLGAASVLGVIAGGIPLALLFSAVVVLEKIYVQQNNDLSLKAEVAQSDALVPTITSNNLPNSTKSLAEQEADLAKASVAQRLAMINDLARKEVNWVAVYPLINRFAPEGIRLTSVGASRGANTITFKIAAVAKDNQTYSSYVDELKKEDPAVVKSVTFDAYTYETTSKQVTFAITAIVPAPMSIPTPVVSASATPTAKP